MSEMRRSPLVDLHGKYIRWTVRGALVKEWSSFLCTISNEAKKSCKIQSIKLYVSSKTMKHLYDKRPGWEYDFILVNLRHLVKYPDRIHRNAESKRGTFLFVKNIKGFLFMASVEEEPNDANETVLKIATAYHVEEKYLKKFPILWTWRDGISSS
jgi:hypothetical protein